MTPKAAFRRPRRSVSRFGDPRRTWRHQSGAAAVVETVTCGGVAIRRNLKGEPCPIYHAVLVTEAGESLVSVHRRLNAAFVAVAKALRPTPKKRKAK